MGLMEDYDSLSAEDQATARARWAEEIDRGIAALDLVSEFEARGESYSELDDAGRVVTHSSRGRKDPS